MSGKGAIGRESLLLLTAHVYYRLGGIVMFMVISRALHVEQIGIFFFALSIAETLSVLGSFNLDPVLMRRTSQAPADSAEHLAAILGFRCLAALLYILRPLSLILPFQFLFLLLLRSLQALHHERWALWMLSGLTIICFMIAVSGETP